MTDVWGQTITYGYDANNNRTQMSLGSTLGASYQYDAANRLTQLTDNVGAVFGFGYDATNNLTSRALPNSINSTLEYDSLDRLTRLKHIGSSSTISDFQYQYNTASQITQIAETANSRNFVYDMVDRLTSATYTAQPNESYAYNAVGNRTSSHLSSTYTYQPFNKLITTNTASYTYDNNGNMTRRTDAAGAWQYFWDAENRLVRVVKPGSGPLPYRTIVYRYDALGRRVARLAKRDGITTFTYDGQDVVLDTNSNGSTTTYVNGLGIDNKLNQTSSVTGTHYYLQDHQGSTRALTDSSGNVSTQMNYDGYGNTTANSLMRYGYTGRELDPDTGLMYYRARWYDPQLGRFISEDPIGFEGGDVNFYSYVGNDPTLYSDPTGLQEIIDAGNAIYWRMNRVRFLPRENRSFDASGEQRIFESLSLMALSQQCADAYRTGGLPAPAELIDRGLVFGEGSRFDDPPEQLDITLKVQAFYIGKGAMNHVYVQAFTIQNIPGQPLAVPSGTPHVFFNETAFNMGASGFTLYGVLAHELIHVGHPGFEPNSWIQDLLYHDLYGFSQHDAIVGACECK